MSRLSAVLDANVLVPAALCDFLLRAAAADLFRIIWTDDILEEVHRTLVNDLGKADEKAVRRISMMKQAFPDALVTHHTPLIASMRNDPKDRHVLAAAVASGAEIIVTSNLSDFSAETVAPHAVEAQSPDQFLIGLLDLDNERIGEILQQQADALRNPPKTVDDILAELERLAPSFVARIRG